MTNTLLFARITEGFCQTASKPIPLIKARNGNSPASLVICPPEKS
jgi:hypothetical protein